MMPGDNGAVEPEIVDGRMKGDLLGTHPTDVHDGGSLGEEDSSLGKLAFFGIPYVEDNDGW